ncbi:MAG TPA: hypothetical protein VFC80_00875 [Sphaerochaeta sp.]|nr:hypothetical protein [Sphaerochaeta sp.]
MPSTDARRLFFVSLILVLALGTPLWSAPAGLSFSTWMPSKTIGGGEGVHLSIGGFVAPHPHLELEANAILALTPMIGEHLYTSLNISTAFAGPFYYTDERATLYYNGLVGATFLGGYDFARQSWSAALGVRVVPFTIGGAYYGRRQRALEFSVLYDFIQEKWSVLWSLLGYDIYTHSAEG